MIYKLNVHCVHVLPCDGLSTPVISGVIRQSRRLPYWMWFAIAKSLGIKLYPTERPVVSAVLHALTIVSAAGEEDGKRQLI
jgi:hypothetical protein